MLCGLDGSCRHDSHLRNVPRSSLLGVPGRLVDLNMQWWERRVETDNAKHIVAWFIFTGFLSVHYSLSTTMPSP
eukprot:7935166-Alexandrium_andersonii.AAC.1